MAAKKIVELQDADGNIIHPHTEDSAVFMDDGRTLKQHLSEEIIEEDVRAIFSSNN